MRRFWSFITNGEYSVGCTGQTVFVFDKNGNELAKFKDIIYAYTPMFCPKSDKFVVKSTDGRLAVYSLSELKLIKKFRFSKIDCSQDDGFCFSPDGKYLYNIERHNESFNSTLSVYETENFSLVNQLFKATEDFRLNHIEYCSDYSSLFVLGQDVKNDKYFVSKFDGEKLVDIQYITENEYDYYSGYKHLELSGFTDKAKEWSALKYMGIDLKDAENVNNPLSKVWQYRKDLKETECF